MTTEKFTPGKWRAEITCHEFCDTGDYILDFGIVTEENIGIAQCFDNSVVNEEEAEANCHLIAAAPEMYSNEEKNLKILKIIQNVYTELKYLFEHDSDVKTCLPNLPEDTFDLILKKIKIRIIKTENALKKARGEER